MDRLQDIQLLRLLRGELGDAERRELDRRLASDALLRARFDRLRTTWRGLENPAPRGAPSGFASSVMEQLEPEAQSSWPVGWRWAATGVACSGIALGALIGAWTAVESVGDPYGQPSMAESYLSLLEEAGS